LRPDAEDNNVSQVARKWPTWKRVLPDVLAFALGLGVAGLLGWKTTDLVWSLWLCSLVLGYLTILSTIGAGVYLGVKAISHKEFPREKRPLGILGGTIAALFFLAFFSLHFCGFHAGHATFLSGFFPLEKMPKNAFFAAFMNPILLWKTVFQYVLPAYGLFLIPAIIAERRHVFASFGAAVKAVRQEVHQQKMADLVQMAKGSKRTMQDPFSRPYINVIRMHLLIFFFAFCHFLKVESFVVFGVVYFVYFFPWSALREDASSAQTVAASSSAEREAPG
jgi:hypothetical protein